MNINPTELTFTDIEDWDAKESQVTGVSDLSEDEVRAIAKNKDALKMLQDDLRRADYKKVK